MLICKNCQRPWKLVGSQWLRKNKKKFDYRCECGSKHKPVDDCNIDNSKSSYIDITNTPWVQELKDELDRGGGYLTDNGVKQQWISSSNNKSKWKYENILLIGDLHLPFTLDTYLDFCVTLYNKYNCDHVIFLGDLLDNHYSSFHATDPDGLSANDELEYAINKLQKWSDVFAFADVCHGNHDLILLRKAYKEGVSKRWIKDFKDVLGVEWNFQPSFEYNNCLFRHGMNMKAAPKSGSEMMNVIQGHFHTEAYITWLVGRGRKVFGMQVPCGVDRESYAMAYAKEFPKPAIGAGVLLEYGKIPIIEMMDL